MREHEEEWGKDISGRPYAIFADLKVGDVLIADGDFTCVEEGSRNVVIADTDGALCFACSEGLHDLLGQTDDCEALYVRGMYLAAEEGN